MPQADPKSSSGQEQDQTGQFSPYLSTYPQHLRDDTIDFYDLWITLRNRKWLVFAVTVVAALGAIVYALQIQRIYKVEAMLLPPKAKDVQLVDVLGIIEGNREKITGILASDTVFSKFKQNLNSLTVHKKFILEHGLLEHLAPDRTAETRNEDIYLGFAEQIRLEEKKGITFLSIELHDAELGTKWVNDLIKFVDKETIVMLVEDTQNSIVNEIRDIEYKIASKRQMAKTRREDQIVRYTEAAKIAASLGIKRRVDATNIIQNTQMNVDIATATTPLYYLGEEALMTEIAILRSRKSDDPFISGLRDMQEKLALLRSIKIDKETLKAVHVDQPAFPPKYAIRPNRKKIVSIATVVGLFSGIFLAFFIEFVQNQRKKHSD